MNKGSILLCYPSSVLSEDDDITEPRSLPESNLLKMKYTKALKVIAAQNKKPNYLSIHAENKSLLEQIEAYQSKRVKRPEAVVPTNTRMPPSS